MAEVKTVIVCYKDEAVECEITPGRIGGALKQKVADVYHLDLLKIALVLPHEFESSEELKKKYGTPKVVEGKGEVLVLKSTVKLQQNFFETCDAAADRDPPAYILVVDTAPQVHQVEVCLSQPMRICPVTASVGNTGLQLYEAANRAFGHSVANFDLTVPAGAPEPYRSPLAYGVVLGSDFFDFMRNKALHLVLKQIYVPTQNPEMTRNTRGYAEIGEEILAACQLFTDGRHIIRDNQAVFGELAMENWSQDPRLQHAIAQFTRDVNLATTELQLQTVVNDLIPSLNGLRLGQAMLEPHSNKMGAVLAGAAPDVFGFLPPVCTPATVTMIGDLKRSSVAADAVATIGQLYYYAQLLQSTSPHGRDSVVLFSFNGRQSVWARVSFCFKTSDYQHWKLSVAETLNGLNPFINTLVTFLTAPRSHTLGFEPVTSYIDPASRSPFCVELKKALGGGATSVVYAAVNHGRELAAKVCRAPHTASDEISFLVQARPLASAGHCLPFLVGYSEDATAFVMFPVGRQVHVLEHTVLCRTMPNVVAVLEKVHTEMGVVHRDIRPPNLITVGTGVEKHVVLIDWGFHAPCNSANPYIGVPHYFSDSLLDQLLDLQSTVPGGLLMPTFSPADDLVALVRSVIILYDNKYKSVLHQLSHLDFEAIRNFWRVHYTEPWMSLAQMLASQGNYTELARIFANLPERQL